jgi:hypothetical protein
MLPKNPTLMQAFSLKKALKINNLYMYGMFRCELYEYRYSIVEICGLLLGRFGMKRKLARWGIAKWAPASGKAKARSPEEMKLDSVSYLSN